MVKKVPHVLYAIVGQTHPEVKKWEGEKYREELKAMIEENGIGENVVMIDRYMEENDLVRHITACDVYVTPYPGWSRLPAVRWPCSRPGASGVVDPVLLCARFACRRTGSADPGGRRGHCGGNGSCRC
ncbi:hypothetical protein VQ056_15370 [Paenibacillus sp. JTLBN-2024]